MSVTLIAILGIVLAPLVSYLVATRKLSGKIGTSDAASLWAESGAIREDYRAQLGQANTRVASLEARVAQVEVKNTELARENLSLGTKVLSYERTITELRDRIDVLEEALEQANTQIKDLLAQLADARDGTA